MIKKNSKQDRETKVLLGLVELYLQTGKPIGSHTLQENGFKSLSSATIRNYFSHLEEQGFLKQQHSSGGRIPTSDAFKLYAKMHYASDEVENDVEEILKSELHRETEEIASYLEHASEALSNLSGAAVFISSPRFDQDFITEIKLLALDATRTLAILITHFGLIHTETLFWPEKIHPRSLKRIQAFFRYRLSGLEEPKLSVEELKIAEYFYNEVFLRHIVKYASFYQEDLYKTGYSKLLQYPELRDAALLTQSLSFFENPLHIRSLLNECRLQNALAYWIDDDLNSYLTESAGCTVLAIPYYIHNKPVGALALLAPTRIPYRKLFGLLRMFSTLLSDNLTKLVYKYQISFREPQTHLLDLAGLKINMQRASCLMLEDLRSNQENPL